MALKPESFKGLFHVLSLKFGIYNNKMTRGQIVDS